MKEALVIQGLDGKKTLKGSIKVNGAKNAVLHGLAMSLLFKDEVIFKNVPEIEDVKNMVEIFKSLGVRVERRSKGSYAIKVPNKISTILPEEISKNSWLLRNLRDISAYPFHHTR